MKRPRAVVIHGHFYQPPRENPWLECVEIQDSAHPFHDWNARVAAECYGPNTAARRVDADNRIVDIVNNFTRISFNVGPTLLSWLETARPDVYAAIIEADRESRARRGHGNAIAQAYGHAILPLASRRDKVTQVRWGLADFRHRFGRKAAGMWLPETAVDRETLEVLADEGVGFTILAPHQAARVRERSGDEWRPVGAAVDPSRPYRFEFRRGRALTLFFYDGPISSAVAFEGLLRSGDQFAARLLQGFDDRRTWPELVHVATDGESYGHHHRFGEMALAACCERLERGGEVELTNYAAYLASLPAPRHAAQVEIVGPSSWSCPHGVERWRADCGCRVGHPGWHQRWRAPLREALEWLRDAVDPLYEARAGAVLKDPWAARDDYIHVVLDRRPASVAAFLARHQLHPLDGAQRVLALTALELQRHRLLMDTSCGWFFDELSGLEGVQVLRYACRVVQLARALGADAGLEDAFVERLGAAPSNLPDLGTGDVVYRRFVLPAAADLRRVAAHYAISQPFEEYGETARLYAFRVDRLGWQREVDGERALAVGRLRVTAELTGETADATVAVLHVGGHDFHAAVRTDLGPDTARQAEEALFRCFGNHGLTEVVRELDSRFDGRSYAVPDLFLEERRRLLTRVTEDVLLRFEETYRRLYEENRRLMRYLRDADVPAPDALALAARYVLERRVEREVALLADEADPAPSAARIGELLTEARSLGIALAVDPRRTARHLEAALLAAIARLEEGLDSVATATALCVLDLGTDLGAGGPDLWTAQNRVFRLGRGMSATEGVASLAPLAARLGLRLEPT
jgi:alpha-amylase/alpha-mannosidase (GH57 family)